MREGLPQSEYAATAATIILTDPEYHKTKIELQKLNLWDKEFEILESEITSIAFELFKK
ncbi:hypothetical protein D3C86_2124690 [compost metagenome]